MIFFSWINCTTRARTTVKMGPFALLHLHQMPVKAGGWIKCCMTFPCFQITTLHHPKYLYVYIALLHYFIHRTWWCNIVHLCVLKHRTFGIDVRMQTHSSKQNTRAHTIIKKVSMVCVCIYVVFTLNEKATTKTLKKIIQYENKLPCKVCYKPVPFSVQYKMFCFKW